jgi:hypothetical protein
MIELIAEGPSASADAIEAAEQELVAKDQRLPPSYRAFLSQHDGGQPKLECFRYQQGAEKREGVINEFLGVRPAPPPATNPLITAGLLRGRIPDGVLPIANDPYGNARRRQPVSHRARLRDVRRQPARRSAGAAGGRRAQADEAETTVRAMKVDLSQPRPSASPEVLADTERRLAALGHRTRPATARSWPSRTAAGR